MPNIIDCTRNDLSSLKISYWSVFCVYIKCLDFIKGGVLSKSPLFMWPRHTNNIKKPKH